MLQINKHKWEFMSASTAKHCCFI